MAFFIILGNFPSPQSEYAQLPLFALTFLAMVPLLIVHLISKIYNCCKKEPNEENNKKEIYKSVPTIEIK